MTDTRGPAWLGIGVQRSGTTWMTELLIQHPEMDVARASRRGKHRRVKEHQFLHRLAEGLVPEERYLERFDDPQDKGVLLGEWTPLYVATLSVPYVARRICQPTAPFFVLMRDPIDRYESAMRQVMQRETPNWVGHDLLKATWHGMYADQLDGWARVVDRERLVVQTFESARSDPSAACTKMWAALDLDPIELSQVDRPSKTSSKPSSQWTWPEGLQEQLIHLYTPQVRRLRDDWGIDVSEWKHFTDVI